MAKSIGDPGKQKKVSSQMSSNNKGQDDEIKTLRPGDVMGKIDLSEKNNTAIGNTKPGYYPHYASGQSINPNRERILKLQGLAMDSDMYDRLNVNDLINQSVSTGTPILKTAQGMNQIKTDPQYFIKNPIARKLADAAMIFNQRADVKKMEPEERVSKFYELGSHDQDVKDWINHNKSIGLDPALLYRSDPMMQNEDQRSKYLKSTITTSPSIAMVDNSNLR